MVTVHRKSVPPHVAAAVAKSLEKLPADRFESAKAFGEALGNPAFTVAGTAGVTAPSSLSRGGRRGSLLAGAVAALALAAAGIIDSLFRVRIDRTPTMVVQAPELVAAMDAEDISNWDLHPDGRRFIVAVPAAVGASSTGAPAVRYLILQNWFSELRRLITPTSK